MDNHEKIAIVIGGGLLLGVIYLFSSKKNAASVAGTDPTATASSYQSGGTQYVPTTSTTYDFAPGSFAKDSNNTTTVTSTPSTPVYSTSPTVVSSTSTQAASSQSTSQAAPVQYTSQSVPSETTSYTTPVSASTQVAAPIDYTLAGYKGGTTTVSGTQAQSNSLAHGLFGLAVQKNGGVYYNHKFYTYKQYAANGYKEAGLH